VESFVSHIADGNAETSKPIQVSHINGGLADGPLGKTEVITWKSKDGMEIEGLLTYPAGFERSRTYPMLLVIHGGPAGVFSETFIGNASPYPIAAFASEGYFVPRANPRGSSGYGAKFVTSQ
jgi:dipeptidyl aminopeptidase/acylaminoacyl peptidase